MPALFKKAKENRSIYIYREKSILWDIEFVLPYCSKNNYNEKIESSDLYFTNIFKKNRISENMILGEIIQEIISNHKSPQQLAESQSEELLVTAYTQAHKDEIIALFRHDSGRFYYLLDLSKSLLENFTFKTIVEYPTIVVTLLTFLHEYPIENSPIQ